MVEFLTCILSLILAVCFQNSCLEWVEGTDTYKMKNDKLT